jgi:transposase
MRRNLFWLSDDQWKRIEPHLPTDVRGVERVDDRRVISGIVHVLKSGCRWCDCPPEYGCHTTIYNRFVRWARRGIWENLFRELAGNGRSADTQMIDSTHVKAHRSAAGGNVWPAPSASDFVDADMNSLHKRIRPFGYAVGQDGDPRVPLLIKGTASTCHFAP